MLASSSLTVFWQYNTSGFWLLETPSGYLSPSAGRGGGKTLIPDLQAQSFKKQGDLLCTVSSQHKLCLVCWGRFDTSVLVWQSQMQIRFVLLKWPVSHRLLQWPWHPSITSVVKRTGWALYIHTAGGSSGLCGKKKITPNERLSLHLVLGLITSREMCQLNLNFFFSLMWESYFSLLCLIQCVSVSSWCCIISQCINSSFLTHHPTS